MELVTGQDSSDKNSYKFNVDITLWYSKSAKRIMAINHYTRYNVIQLPAFMVI
jgi:hypothetical protein